MSKKFLALITVIAIVMMSLAIPTAFASSNTYTSMNHGDGWGWGDKDGLTCALYAPSSATGISTHIVNPGSIKTGNTGGASYTDSYRDNFYLYLSINGDSNVNGDYGLVKIGNENQWRITKNGQKFYGTISNISQYSDIQMQLIYSGGQIYFQVYGWPAGDVLYNSSIGTPYSISNVQYGRIASIAHYEDGYTPYSGTYVEDMARGVKFTGIVFQNTYYYYNGGYSRFDTDSAHLWLYPNTSANSGGVIGTKGTSGTPIVSINANVSYGVNTDYIDINGYNAASFSLDKPVLKNSGPLSSSYTKLRWYSVSGADYYEVSLAAVDNTSDRNKTSLVSRKTVTSNYYKVPSWMLREASGRKLKVAIQALSDGGCNASNLAIYYFNVN